jgi:hypothetical protein
MPISEDTLSLARKVNPKAEMKDVIEMTTLDFQADAVKNYRDLLQHKHYGWGFMDANHNLYFNIHGTKFGQMSGFGASLRPQDLGLILKNSNLIDSNVKSIYTISCYGGLQTPFTMDSGISISSSHTSQLPVIGAVKGGVSTLTSTDGGDLVEGAKGLGTAKNIGVAITPEEFIEASKKYLESLPTLTAEEAKKIYTYSKAYQIGDASYYYSQGYSQKEFHKIVDDKISHLKGQIEELKNNPTDTSEKTIAEYEKNIKRLEGYKEKDTGYRKLDKEEEIIAKRYKKDAFYKDWEELSPEEKYDKYKNDYTKYKEERRLQWEERKRLEAEQFIEGEDGQMTIRDAQPSPKTSVLEETSTSIKNEITPSFVDKNGKIKDEYIVKPKEETTIIIEDDNTGVKTETSSTKDTSIPDSSANQNNAEKVKQQEPINNPEKPNVNTKPDPPNYFDTSSYSKHQIKELQEAGLIEKIYLNDGKNTIIKYKKTEKFTDDAVKRTLNPYRSAFDGKNKNIDSTRTSYDQYRKPNKPEKPKPEKPKPEKPKPEKLNTKPDIEAKPQPEVQAEAKTPQPDKPKKPNYKPQKGPKTKSTNINATKEQIEKAVKETGMKAKKLTGDAAKAIGEGVNWGKVGKVGAVVGVAALIGGGIYSHAKKEKKNRANGPDRLTGATRKSEFWNQSYAAQMAKDISTYQYGKRMTGFVQG